MCEKLLQWSKCVGALQGNWFYGPRTELVHKQTSFSVDKIRLDIIEGETRWKNFICGWQMLRTVQKCRRGGEKCRRGGEKVEKSVVEVEKSVVEVEKRWRKVS